MGVRSNTLRKKCGIGTSWNAVTAFFLCLSFTIPCATAQIIISEIMYHPSSDNPQEQWFELQNSGVEEVSLAGCKIETGVQFDFPAGTVIPAGGALVVAADTSAFAFNNPAVTNIVGGWTGKLAREGERITITDGHGNTLSDVTYAMEGDWALLSIGTTDIYGLAGWTWFAEHDGNGKSLERVNLLLSTSSGQNWRSSTVPGGTPGRANSVAETDSAPLITEVRHVPVVPRSTDTVTITLLVTDEAVGNAGVSATLHWRCDGVTPQPFSDLPLLDDGSAGDAIAHDGLYTARLPPQQNGTIVEYTVDAQDAAGHLRTYPVYQTNASGRTAPLLYQVDNITYSGPQPLIRLIMNAKEYAFLSGPIWVSHPKSDAQVCGTLIYQAPGVSAPEIHPQSLLGNRGNGTRTENPHNIHVSVSADNPWGKRTSVNLNTERTHSQNMGSALARLSGLPMPESRAAQVRINGQNLALPGTPQFGSYAMNETVDQAFADRQFPNDPEGNLYRGVRNLIGSSNADLRWLGASYGAYTNAFKKENNKTANDWSDFILLVDTLNNATEANYTNAIDQILNANQWMRYFAFNTLTGNRETCLGTGIGDDFAMFCGLADPRFLLLPYDVDSILGQSDGVDRATTYGDGIWRMVQSVPVVTRLIRHPAYAPLYFAQLRDLAATVFLPERVNTLIDTLIGGHVAATTLANMKAFNASHRTYVLSQIPSALAITTTFCTSNGYPSTNAMSVSLSGVSDAVRTRRVTVNGTASAWTAWSASWTAGDVPLQPGLNHLCICAYDADEAEIGRLDYDLLRTTSDVYAHSGGTLSTNATWSAASGPHRIDGTLTVAAGATLSVEAGASVFLVTGASLTITNGGRLLSEGTTHAPITFSGVPGASAWKQIRIFGAAGAPETRITHTHITGNGSTAILADGGTVNLDQLSFGNATNAYLSLSNASFMVSHCTFPKAQASFVPIQGGGIRADGRGVFYRNFFGAATGSNDIVRFVGGRRGETPLVHFIENVFNGAGDDLLDLDGTDAWVEGNILMHAHKSGSPDSSGGVSGGNSQSATTNTSETTLIGNVFYDCDQASTVKQGSFHTLCNNTILRQTHSGGTDTNGAVVNFNDAAGVASSAGLGAYFSDNVASDIENLTRNTPQVSATFTNNLLPAVWNGRGGNNRVADPRFVHTPELPETLAFMTWEQAQVLRSWAGLRPESSGCATSQYGQNQGALSTRGIIVSGVPQRITTNTAITLHFGPIHTDTDFGTTVAGFPEGSGYTHVRYRLITHGEPGPWSTPRPTAEALVLEGLTNDTYAIEASGRLDTGLYQDDPALGEAACVTRSALWTVDTAAPPPSAEPSLRISEVLAKNLSTAVYDNSETYPDLIELHNIGTATIDLTGMRMTDDPDRPDPFIFQTGTFLAPGAYLTLVAGLPPTGYTGPLPHSGFALNANGETLSLYNADGTLIDQVTFGLQIQDTSIGRAGAGLWTLCTPTFGAANAPAARTDARVLKINEWLAAAYTAPDDFVELYNPTNLPADISGTALTDAPGTPNRHRLPALSFIAPYGFTCLLADGNTAAGANHLGFKLAADTGSIALSTDSLELIDAISYGTQQPDVSEGRIPNGGTVITALPVPTPGASNPGSSTGPTTTETQTLLAMTNNWRYFAVGSDLGNAWRAPGYDDSAWPSGRALFYCETAALAAAKNTPLALGITTYYFRTPFTVGTNLTGWVFNISTIVDDGAVVYLNGTEVVRIHMPSGVISNATLATSHEAVLEGPFQLPSEALLSGTNVLAVEVHQNATNSSDVVFGLALEARITQPATENIGIRISELFTAGRQPPGAADWIELFNTGTNEADLSDMSLTDRSNEPRRFVFPFGTRIPASSYLVVPCSDVGAAGETGFALDSASGGAYLFAAPAAGGALVDAVVYGLQPGGYSLARQSPASNIWALATPSPLHANTPVTLGTADALRVNEWMANPSSGDDWFELVNTGTLPVALGDLWLTDNLSRQVQHRIAPLSFIGAGDNAWSLFVADNKPDLGAGHVSFKLNNAGEAIALLESDGTILDVTSFGSQTKNVSQGRFPDGAGRIIAFTAPTPGSSNVRPPATPDYDGDGMSDAFELLYGFNPADPSDGLWDSDGDGVSNADEYLAGTSPRDRNEVLRIPAAHKAPGSSGFLLIIPVSAGRSYTVQTCDDLAGNVWTRFVDLPPQPFTRWIEITDDTLAQRRFYRVVTPAEN